MVRMFVEAPVTPGAKLNDAAQFLEAELDRRAAEHGRTVHGPVTILEGPSAFGERVLRLEASVV